MLLSRLTSFEKDCLYEHLLETQMEYRDLLNLNDDTTFGIEIEAYTEEFVNISKSTFIEDMIKIKNKTYSSWQLTEEKKLGPNDESGYELISPILTNTKETWSSLKEACEFLKSEKLFINEKCGAHVHVGLKTIEKDNIVNIFKLWAAFEDVLYRFSFGEYTNPRVNMIKYSAPIRNQILKIINSQNLDEQDLNNILNNFFLGKNKAINIQNIRDYVMYGENKPTIEFRMSNGTLNPIIWQNLINVYSRMIEYASDNFYIEMIDYLLETEEVPNFGESYFYSKNYFERALLFSDLIFKKTEDKIYFLKQYIKDGTYTKEKTLVKSLSFTK